MDLHSLRLFLAVVDGGGMTRAAEAEHVSQPSVSQAIRELENELGTPLFHRVGRRVVLTAAVRRSSTPPARCCATSRPGEPPWRRSPASRRDDSTSSPCPRS